MALRGVLDAAFLQRPDLRQRLLDDTGEQRRFANLYVDGVDVRRSEGLATAVPDGAEVFVVGSIAGG